MDIYLYVKVVAGVMSAMYIPMRFYIKDKCSEERQLFISMLYWNFVSILLWGYIIGMGVK